MDGCLRGFKPTLDEGGRLNPTIAWWPRTVPAGFVRDELWMDWDLRPTLAELAGVTLPAGAQFDGRSIAALIRRGAAPQRP